MWLAFLTNISSFAHSLIAFFDNVTHVGQCDGPVCGACSIVAVSPRDCACSIKALTGSLSGIANVSSASLEPYPIIRKKKMLDLSLSSNFHFFSLEIGLLVYVAVYSLFVPVSVLFLTDLAGGSGLQSQGLVCCLGLGLFLVRTFRLTDEAVSKARVRYKPFH